MKISASSVSDPFQLTQPSPASLGVGHYVLDGRVPEIVGTIGANERVIITVGQSNAGNSGNAAYTPTNAAAVQNFCIHNGGNYRARDAMLGCAFNETTPGNFATRLGDKLIAAGRSRVIFVPIAIGATAVAQWAAGGDCNHRIGVTCRRLAAANITPSYVLWHQGENDTLAGTATAAYKASLASVIGTFRGFYPSLPIFVARASYVNGAVSSAVTTAQTEILAEVSNLFAGANTDTLGSGSRFDNTHFTASGQNSHADLWLSAIQAAGI